MSELEFALTNLLRDHYGRSARLHGGEAVDPVGRKDGPRHYYRYAFTANQRPDDMHVFVKSGRVRQGAFENFIGGDHAAKFYAPLFIGELSLPSETFGVWEYIEGEHWPFDASDPASLDALTAAIAAINAMPLPDDPALGLRAENPWAEGIGQRAAAWAAAHGHDRIAAMRRVLERLPAIERALTGLLTASPRLFCTHHDIKPYNVLRSRSHDCPVIIDWASARLSVAGTGLRFLVNLESSSHDRIARLYTHAMAAAGHELNDRGVLFAAIAQQALWAVRSGINRDQPRRFLQAQPAVELLNGRFADYLD